MSGSSWQAPEWTVGVNTDDAGLHISRSRACALYIKFLLHISVKVLCSKYLLDCVAILAFDTHDALRPFGPLGGESWVTSRPRSRLLPLRPPSNVSPRCDSSAQARTRWGLPRRDTRSHFIECGRPGTTNFPGDADATEVGEQRPTAMRSVRARAVERGLFRHRSVERTIDDAEDNRIALCQL